MKVRVGFVSNSSSSSFVAVGFNIKDIDITEKQLFTAMGWDAKKEYDEFAHKDRYSFEEYVEDYMYEGVNNLGFHILRGGDDGVNNDDHIICEMIADISSEDYMPQEAFSFESLKERFVGIEELRQKIAPDIEMMVYTGTRMC